MGKGLLGAVLLVLSTLTFASEWFYTVQSGDNLWNLTERHLTNLKYVGRLQKLNRIQNPYQIAPGTVIRIPIDWTKQQFGGVRARIIGVNGQAVIKRSSSVQTVSAEKGMRLFVGDEIYCENDAFVTVEFADKSHMRVQDNSRVRLKQLNIFGQYGLVDTLVEIEQGRIESTVPKNKEVDTRFRIKTPSAISSVRGTDFRVGMVGVQEDRTSSEVLQGAVRVAANNRDVNISAGFGLVTVLGSAPSKPVALLPPPDFSITPILYERLPLVISLHSLAGAQSYRAQIATDQTFQNLLAEFVTPKLPFREGDLPDGEYWLRVRGIDQSGIEGQDAVMSFEINARPEAPFILAPLPGGVLDVNNQELKWSAQSEAANYILTISEQSDLSDPIFTDSEIYENKLKLTEPLAPGKYYWHIASVSASEGAGPYSDVMTFRVPFPGPELAAPEVGDDELTLAWGAAAEDQHFHFQIASDKDFKELLYDEATLKSRVTIPTPEGGRYYLRVKTIESDGFEGPFGSPQVIDIPQDTPYWLLLLLLPLLILI